MEAFHSDIPTISAIKPKTDFTGVLGIAVALLLLVFFATSNINPLINQNDEK